MRTKRRWIANRKPDTSYQIVTSLSIWGNPKRPKTQLRVKIQYYNIKNRKHSCQKLFTLNGYVMGHRRSEMEQIMEVFARNTLSWSYDCHVLPFNRSHRLCMHAVFVCSANSVFSAILLWHFRT